MVVIVAAFASWFLLWALIPLLRKRLLDQPNVRSSHISPTPRGGGVAFVIVTTIGSFIAACFGIATWALPLVTCALPLAVVGLVDDRINLNAGLRYGIQLLTSAALLAFSPLLRSWILSAQQFWVYPVVFFLIVAVTAVINFTNFMDGLDGLVASCLLVAFSAAALTFNGSEVLWILIGGLLGFLIWNWSPAKVFMGDVGSTFLGALWAGCLLQSSSWLEAAGLLLVSTPLLADAFVCVVRRLIAGQHIFKAHRLHLFQRLNQAGWSHSQVATLYLSATAVLAVSWLIGAFLSVLGFAVLSVLIGFWLDQRYALSFSLASENS